MLSLDTIILGVPEVSAARAFYTSVLAPAANDDEDGDFGGDEGRDQQPMMDMHGTGHFALGKAEALAADAKTDHATSGFRGYIMSYIVKQPSEVKTLLNAAVERGATVLKPAKKSLFGAFSAVYKAPDGSIWKLSAPTKKDTGPAGTPPIPTETAALIGVAAPKVSKTFYTALGMTVDRDYGNSYIDFVPAAGACRLGLMPRRTLAKDAGVKEDGAGFRAVVFQRMAASREEVDALLTAAAAAGGQIAVPAGETVSGGYAGHFIDPDGFLWKVTAA